MEKKFKIHSKYKPSGDQPKAIEKLVEGLNCGDDAQTLLGITGSGKTFTIANVIEKIQKPTLIIAHNKTLAAQLYNEFKELFPENAVEYFISYYDYYQPEAYIPRTDTYIEKSASINEEIDRLRHNTTRSLYERNDVIIVASVSCIYGLGLPENYFRGSVELKVGDEVARDDLLKHLVSVQYTRNDLVLERSNFRARGDIVEIMPAYEKVITRIYFFGDEIEKIVRIDNVTGEILETPESVVIGRTVCGEIHAIIGDAVLFIQRNTGKRSVCGIHLRSGDRHVFGRVFTDISHLRAALLNGLAAASQRGGQHCHSGKHQNLLFHVAHTFRLSSYTGYQPNIKKILKQ